MTDGPQATGRKPQTLPTIRVEGALSKVSFHGASVAIGFVASHRKPKHLDCESGRGFLTMIEPGGKRLLVTCPCAERLAKKRLVAVGFAEFERLGAEWAKKANSRQRTADSKTADSKTEDSGQVSPVEKGP